VNILKAGMPHCKDPETWYVSLMPVFARFGISTPDRQAAFLGQAAAESGEFNHLEENLSYTAPRIAAVWPSLFANSEDLNQFALNPQKLANKVYAKKNGNGDEASGDGWRFRGRGIFQHTGRWNYQHIQNVTGIAVCDNPDLLLVPGNAAMAAGLFWQEKHLNELADTGDIQGITRRINGGDTGLDARKQYTNTFKRLL
jgi:putative chitinase